MKDSYCDNCERKVPTYVRSRKATIKYNHHTTIYDEAYAICKFCGKEAYDLVVEDMNNKRRAFALSDIQQEVDVCKKLKRRADNVT